MEGLLITGRNAKSICLAISCLDRGVEPSICKLARKQSESGARAKPAFLLLLRERTLVAAGHLAAKIWELTRIYLLGGVVEYKIVSVVRIGTKYAGELQAREALL